MLGDELDLEGPTAEELAAIELELPLIEAGVDLVDAQIRALTAEGGAKLARRRVRRALSRVRREALAYQDRLAAAARQDVPCHVELGRVA